MSALEDRRRWLDHLHECGTCPADLCDEGRRLADAVAASMAPGETWEAL